MNLVESILLATGYTLMYGSLLVLARGGLYLMLEGIEYMLEVLLD